MNATLNFFVRFGRWLKHKPNFLLLATLWFAVPFAVVFIWKFRVDDVVLALIIVAMSLLGGLLFAVCMWPIMGMIVARAETRVRQIAAKSARESTDSYRRKPR